uniref:Uncharacterized protein n=1 Tax=Haemonchus placei TaxID=6290 RepID=A0A0N4WLL6_HAEPC
MNLGPQDRENGFAHWRHRSLKSTASRRDSILSSVKNPYQRVQNTPEFSVTQQTSTSEEVTQLRSLRSRSRTEGIIVPDSTSRLGTPPRRCTHTTRRVWYNDHWTEPLVSPLCCITRDQNLFERQVLLFFYWSSPELASSFNLFNFSLRVYLERFVRVQKQA